MQIQEQQITLIKLVAGEGKIIVSKELDEDGNPVIMAKEIYLPSNADVNDFEEINYVEEAQVDLGENEEEDENE